jgi:hypothetical protein
MCGWAGALFSGRPSSESSNEGAPHPGSLTRLGIGVAANRYLSNEQVQLAWIETRLKVVVSTQLENSESVLVSAKPACDRFLQIDQAALNHEKDQSRFWRVVSDDERMSLACRFVDKCSWFRDPIMFEYRQCPRMV